jgi:putative hydrolase of the HAD superfamily
VSSLAAERRAARERALGLLYEAEVKGCSGAEVVADLPVPPDAYAGGLVAAVDEHRTRLDELIERYAKGWTLARMPALDRAAVRMGGAELLTRPDVPTGVVLAETVDLAARFSTDGSGRFVNGLLARLARELRGHGPDEAADQAAVEEPPRERTVDALIIDLDGVIRHWDPIEITEADLGLPTGALAAAAFEPDRLARSMDGRLSFEAWTQELAEEVARTHGADAAEVAEAWADTSWRIDLEVIDLVRAVRAGGTPVALLSNASTRLEEDLDRSGITDELDHILGSATLGVAKPDPTVFRLAADRVGAPPDRCLFIDDQPANVQGAREAGMVAEVYTGVDDLRVHLRDAGLL